MAADPRPALVVKARLLDREPTRVEDCRLGVTTLPRVDHRPDAGGDDLVPAACAVVVRRLHALAEHGRLLLEAAGAAIVGSRPVRGAVIDPGQRLRASNRDGGADQRPNEPHANHGNGPSHQLPFRLVRHLPLVIGRARGHVAAPTDSAFR